MNQENLSYWQQTSRQLGAPPLSKSTQAEIVIVGGGIVGITCAYYLALEGAKPLLLEADCLCGGTTGNTTGKVTIQHGILYSSLLKTYGPRVARAYARSQTEALELVRSLTEELGIRCQLAERTSYLYASVEDQWEAVEQEYEAAVQLGIQATLERKPQFPTPNFGMVGFPRQAAFHPVRYVQTLAHAAAARGASIHCETRVLGIDDDGPALRVRCAGGITVEAGHVMMATQYPLHDGLNLFFSRLYPKRSYAIAVQAERPWPQDNYINAGEPTRSVRTHIENGAPILIVGGESHPPGRGMTDTEAHYNALLAFARELTGECRLLAKWSAQDYETPDRIPYIGKAVGGRGLYVAAGFGKWGMTSGTLAGRLLAQLALHGKCDYEGLYSKARPDFSSEPGRTAKEMLTPVAELVKSKFKGTQPFGDLQPGQGRAISFQGKRAGVYRGWDDRAFVVDITCTHMGGELSFNPAEKTWDCPVHGGRFDVRGNRLEGPPHRNLRLLFQGDFSQLTQG